MTSPDLDTMHRAILLDPGDDLARLAFADACEEAGELGLAEFVRVQVELARPLPCKDSAAGPCFDRLAGMSDMLRTRCDTCRATAPRVAKLRSDERRWVERNRKSLREEFGLDVWLARQAADMPHTMREPPGVMLLRRGLVESVSLPLESFMEHAGELFSRHPITAVTLTDREPNDGSVAGRGVLYAWLTWRWCYMKAVLIPGGVSRPYDVPHELFGDGPPKWLYFDTTTLAHAALSAACVAFGRRLAGLPPLLPATGRAVDGPAVVR